MPIPFHVPEHAAVTSRPYPSLRFMTERLKAAQLVPMLARKI